MDLGDSTLEEIRLALVHAVAEAAVFDGWSDAAVAGAARQNGLDPSVARLAYPGGAMDMLDAWAARIDADMSAALPAGALAKLPVRERIRQLVQFRLDAVKGREEALSRALAILAMPHNAPRAAQLAWRSADVMWRLAGDVATDYNHYTKRAILGSIYAATLAVLAHDSSQDRAETRAFLDRRIEGVMRFEKAKAKWLDPQRERFSPARFLGRLRYPVR